MPDIAKFIDEDWSSIEFSKCGNEVLVTIDNQGSHVNDLTYFSLTKDNLSNLVPKLTALLIQLEDKGE
tara:strand:- start:646 stop:849 length:204 start_codon:yes stop_codon:yes gene_type:complete